jgi:hypothetical protein
MSSYSKPFEKVCISVRNQDKQESVLTHWSSQILIADAGPAGLLLAILSHDKSAPGRLHWQTGKELSLSSPRLKSRADVTCTCQGKE